MDEVTEELSKLFEKEKSNFIATDSVLVDYMKHLLCGGYVTIAYREDPTDAVFNAIGHMIRSEKSREICSKIAKIMTLSLANSKSLFDSKIGGELIAFENPVQIKEFDMSSRHTSSVKMADLAFLTARSRQVAATVNEKAEKAKQRNINKQVKKDKKIEMAMSEASLNNESNEFECDADDEFVSSTGVRDVIVENFDILFGGKKILIDASICLSFGRRYGLVGRNGIGKSTLLKHLSSRILNVPKNISILHVEQEVIGNEVTAIESVLSADTLRAKLLKEEKELLAKKSESESSSRLKEIYAKLDEIEADKAESRASVILSGLGFSQEAQHRATKTFSGGWRMRISLARALFRKPDLLLLDEPTNMLDIPAVVWLSDYLENEWKSTLLVVSHDRQFLNNVATDILHMHHEKVDYYRGNYESFVTAAQEKQKHALKEYENQVAYRAHLQEFIDKWRYNAARAALAQSKIKILEKLPPLTPPPIEPTIIVSFPPAPDKMPTTFVSLDEVSFWYDGKTEQDAIFRNVNFSLSPKSRIALVGPNGAGKTTLLKILTGDLEAKQGKVTRDARLRFGYFSQHFVDHLDLKASPLTLLSSRYPHETQESVRRALGSFGLSGPLALQTIGTLSGGQKARVAFASIALGNPYALILDEPTNHLDMDTIAALTHSLRNWNGGVLVVSHDKQFVDGACDEIWSVDSGKVSRLTGSLSDYVKSLKSLSKI